MSIPFKTALLASALIFAAPAVQAQETGYSEAAYAPESVTVQAPRFRADRNGLNAPSKISLSQEVPFDDLDLRTRDGARELQFRVSEAAHAVCGQLAENYAIPPLPGTHCYRDAYQAGLVRAQAAIRDARYSGGYRSRLKDVFAIQAEINHRSVQKMIPPWPGGDPATQCRVSARR